MGKFNSNFIVVEKHPIVDLTYVYKINRVDVRQADQYRIRFFRDAGEDVDWKFTKIDVRDKVFNFLCSKVATFYSFNEIEGLDKLEEKDLWNDSQQTEQEQETQEQ